MKIFLYGQNVFLRWVQDMQGDTDARIFTVVVCLILKENIQVY